MKKNVEQVFLREILEECNCILLLIEKINECLQKNGSDQLPILFRSLRYLVIHAGMISKYFWPNSYNAKKTKDANLQTKLRGKHLRNLVGKDIVLLKDKKLRNHLEHFDERLDYWASLDLPYLKNIVIQRELVGKALTGKIGKNNSFNFYDPKQHIYEICCDQFNVQLIVNEVIAIRNRIIPLLPENKIFLKPQEPVLTIVD